MNEELLFICGMFLYMAGLWMIVLSSFYFRSKRFAVLLVAGFVLSIIGIKISSISLNAQVDQILFDMGIVKGP